jgi:O-antigen/teichoic acid export membrane protein
MRDRTRLLKQVIPWGVKGGLTILDQGLASGSTFLLGILLARWLPSDQYGAYALALAIYVLMHAFYQALVLEPMAVFGGSVYHDQLRPYLGTLFRVHILAGLGIFAILGFSAEVTRVVGKGDGLAGALAALALACPFFLLFSLARRAFYLKTSPGTAACGAAVFSALTLGGICVAYECHWVSPMSALLLIGVGALGSSVLLLAILRLRLPRTLSRISFRKVWNRHWQYGRWALAGAFMMWIPANIFYPLLSTFSGMKQAGELKALMNFGAPVVQAYGSISSALLLPYAARAMMHQQSGGAEALMRKISCLFVFGAVAYWAVVLLLRWPIFRVLYSGRYTQVAYLLPVVALGSILWSAYLGPATTLRAMESPESVFYAVCISSCVAFAVGLPATWAFGIRGAVWAMALSEGLAFIAAVLMLRRNVRPAAAVRPPTFWT